MKRGRPKIENKEKYSCITCGSKILKWFNFKLSLCSKCKSKRAHKFYEIDSKKSEYKRRFGGLRELIIQRDGERCVMCGRTRQENKLKYGRDITVDHIDKHGRNAENKNHNPYNLQTLCCGCHGYKDAVQHGKYSVYGANLNRERLRVTF